MCSGVPNLMEFQKAFFMHLACKYLLHSFLKLYLDWGKQKNIGCQTFIKKKPRQVCKIREIVDSLAIFKLHESILINGRIWKH